MTVVFPGAPGGCLANRPRSGAACTGLVVPDSQRGPLGADRHYGDFGLFPDFAIIIWLNFLFNYGNA